MNATRKIIIKALITVSLLFQLINVAWAANHNCCPEDNPDCAMVSMAIGCTACISAALPTKTSVLFSEYHALVKTPPSPLNYRSVNVNVIWRPPISSLLT